MQDNIGIKGEAIREARSEMGMTQELLMIALRKKGAEITTGTVNRMENNKVDIRQPHYWAGLLAEIFHKKKEYFLKKYD